MGHQFTQRISIWTLRTAEARPQTKQRSKVQFVITNIYRRAITVFQHVRLAGHR